MVARTCPGWGPDMSGFGYWNLARKPDMSGFLESLVQGSFSMICTSPTHSMHPPLDSTELLGHK
jgi:hypothetical protein